MTAKANHLLVVHGGAPTAVMNASLYGVISEARKKGKFDKILAARHGMGGILREDFIDLTDISDGQLALLLSTPASMIGTSRDPLEKEDYEKIAGILKKYGIGAVLANGGNGTMDTCGKIAEVAENVMVVGIPKTIDNDIAVTDHAPGYGSAARYIAGTVAEISHDVASLPIHVCIVEVMGRNAGWIAAASALARETGFGPDMIYLPERPFHKEDFLALTESIHKRKGGVTIVVSEGLRDENGIPVAKPVFTAGRAIYYGDVSAELAALVIRELGIKARSEKPGIAGRASIAWQSPLDRDEAILVGKEAVKAATEGITGVMPGFRRIGNTSDTYQVETFLIPIEQVMMHERTVPEHFLSGDCDVADAFIRWVKPLAGGPLPRYAKL